MSFADQFLYFPTHEHDGGTPATIGLEYEDVYLQTSDGVRVHAWFVPATPATHAILFLHGNGGNISHRLDKLSILHGMGVSVLLLDYRGYGASEGAPEEAGIYRDAESAYEWLERHDGAQLPILVYGESLGGTVGTDLGARRAIAALILESAPSSMLAVARHHYPLLPLGLLLSSRYDALSKIAAVKAPILILHSTDDEIVPFAMGEEMYRAATAPKQLVRLRGGHNDNFIVAADTYRIALEDFIKSVPSPIGRD